jgi:hypothetical protein
MSAHLGAPNAPRAFLEEEWRILSQGASHDAENLDGRSRGMLRDEGVEVASTWAQEETAIGYREIDRQLRAIATKRAGLDVEEARWLREAERLRVWRKLGFSTALEYLEDVFGYAPRTAMERLRVARELGELPELEAEVRSGALPYSAAKELSRVMTSATESAWLARARGKNLRDIEELVAGHKKGDVPDAPKDPSLIGRKRAFELPPHVDALLEQCRGIAAEERGSHVDDAELVELLCRTYLAGPGTASDKPTRPAHRIVIHKYDCGCARQQSRGRMVELRANELECAECDADIVQEDGAENDTVAENQSRSRSRARPTIPRRVRNRVWARDQGRCRVPGCRATRNLDIHHIVHRAAGGDHDASNLIVLCSGHHMLHHDGLIIISGRAPDQLQFVRDGKPLIDSRAGTEWSTDEQGADDSVRTRSRFGDVVKLEYAKQALMQLGYKGRGARKALEEISSHVGADAEVASLVEAVLARDRGASDTSNDEDVFALAKQALVQLGYPASIARRAIESARGNMSSASDLQAVLKEALRRCAAV